MKKICSQNSLNQIEFFFSLEFVFQKQTYYTVYYILYNIRLGLKLNVSSYWIYACVVYISILIVCPCDFDIFA
jgi:hypothetical protein